MSLKDSGVLKLSSLVLHCEFVKKEERKNKEIFWYILSKVEV